MKLFSQQASIVKLLANNAPRVVQENSLELFLKTWKELREFLGPYGLAYLMQQNPEDFETFLTRLRLLFKSK